MITGLTRNYPCIKIIAMSQGEEVDSQGYLERAEHLGAGRTLTKPFKHSDPIDAVRELLNG